MFGQDNQKEDTSAQPISAKPVNNGLLGIDDDTDDITSASSPNPIIQPVPTPPIPDTPTLSVVSPSQDNTSTDSPVTTPEPKPVVATNPYSTPPAYSQQTSPTSPATTDDLVNIKRQALQDLSPLINHLDQNPEEKFKTTMMMIQASDDKDLIPQAYQTAKDIADETKRAQALLDIVNEINYFTHKTE